jgi:hypothetical protein
MLGSVSGIADTTTRRVVMTVPTPETDVVAIEQQGFSDEDADDEDEVCSDPFDEGCRMSLDDGEGYDGACGSCADRLEDAGHWS